MKRQSGGIVVAKAGLCFFCGWCVLSSVAAGAPSAANSGDAEFLDNIRNYMDSAPVMRFKATFEGTQRRGIAEFDDLSLRGKGEYEVLRDAGKGLWKLQIRELFTPPGDLTPDEFTRLTWKDGRQLGKSKENVVEYFLPEEGNYASIWPANSDARDIVFQYTMQLIDPISYIKRALPAGSMRLTSVEDDGSTVRLVYEAAPDAAKVVVLSRAHNMLPVKIYNEGKGWESYKEGKFSGIFIDIEYAMDPGSTVVKSVSFKNAREEGRIEYAEASYTEPIADEDFVVRIPSNAQRILDEATGILTYPSLQQAEILEEIQPIPGQGSAQQPLDVQQVAAAVPVVSSTEEPLVERAEVGDMLRKNLWLVLVPAGCLAAAGLTALIIKRRHDQTIPQS